MTGMSVNTSGAISTESLNQHRYDWRAAFLIQIPLFCVSFVLTGYNLRYVTPVRLTVKNTINSAHSWNIGKG